MWFCEARRGEAIRGEASAAWGMKHVTYGGWHVEGGVYMWKVV